MLGYDFSDLTTNKPEKSLTKFIGSTGWRNNQWRITSRFMWGWHKRLYRIVDFKGYDKCDIPAKVASIEYDPYRTPRIALLNYADWEKRYVLAWKWVKVGDEVMAWDKAPIADWNRKQLKDIPEGMTVYNLEVTPFSTGKVVKTAGSSALISGRDEATGLVFIKMPSGEVRKFNKNCAGRQRWKGKRPHILWKNMNPVDHPHGGWEAHSPIGSKRWQKSFSGKRVAAGMKTRSQKKWSTKFIVSGRTK